MKIRQVHNRRVQTVIRTNPKYSFTYFIDFRPFTLVGLRMMSNYKNHRKENQSEGT